MAGFKAVCIASGPSLTQDDVDYVRGKAKVYVVNDAYKLAPWAEVLYACDEDWWDYHNPDFQGEKYTISKSAAHKYKLNCLKYDARQEWGKEIIATGGNSGFQAMNLAYLHGASEIYLLGYDMGYNDDKSHFFGDHPHHMQKNPDFAKWVDNFRKAAPHIDIPIINCSRKSAIDCFEKMDVRKCL